jgi:hypothetical protein
MKKWKGIQQNEVTLQGEVIAAPVFNAGYAFMTLRTNLTQRDANGQIVDLDQDIPLMVEPGNLVPVVEKHVMAGRKILVNGQYKSWEVQGNVSHAIVVGRMKLGDKPFEPKNDEANVPLPPH